jgi:CheY-like chemotaxis protein
MQLSAARVLIVDDNPKIRLLLTGIVEPLTAEVRGYGDAISGLGAWPEYRPHLVFVDYEMPEVSGATLIKIARAQEPALGLRSAILMVTAHNDRQHVMAAKEAGADAFIVKPLDPPAILRRTMQVLSKVNEHHGREVAYI